eukprot:TRINITY_DN1063_c0_g1_i1.p1 TRINITY_DN1063_c0_g1~~TRINITY_DN1063_c0_g1_i1.p1  ORF type:complete len:419 (+),score=137.26 TRINITY_DN1063_c0_g1_i1:64-1320(+)
MDEYLLQLEEIGEDVGRTNTNDIFVNERVAFKLREIAFNIKDLLDKLSNKELEMYLNDVGTQRRVTESYFNKSMSELQTLEEKLQTMEANYNKMHHITEENIHEDDEDNPETQISETHEEDPSKHQQENSPEGNTEQVEEDIRMLEAIREEYKQLIEATMRENEKIKQEIHRQEAIYHYSNKKKVEVDEKVDKLKDEIKKAALQEAALKNERTAMAPEIHDLEDRLRDETLVTQNHEMDLELRVKEVEDKIYFIEKSEMLISPRNKRMRMKFDMNESMDKLAEYTPNNSHILIWKNDGEPLMIKLREQDLMPKEMELISPNQSFFKHPFNSVSDFNTDEEHYSRQGLETEAVMNGDPLAKGALLRKNSGLSNSSRAINHYRNSSSLVSSMIAEQKVSALPPPPPKTGKPCFGLFFCFS